MLCGLEGMESLRVVIACDSNSFGFSEKKTHNKNSLPKSNRYIVIL